MPIKFYQPIQSIWFYLFVIGVLISLATYTWQFRKIPGAKQQVYIHACKFFWLLFQVLTSVSITLADKLFWFKLNQMAAVLTPYFWLVFVLNISNQQRKISPIVKYGFLAMIGGLWVGIMSNFFLRDAWLEDRTLKVVAGTAAWAMWISSYLLCAITMAFSVRWVLVTAGLRRKQALWFTISGLFSLVGTFWTHIPGSQAFAPLPLGFLVSGLLVTWGFYRWHVYSVLPLAQETAVRNMIDGLLVVDEYGYIADINPAAKTELTGLPVSVGGRFSELAAAWPALNEVCGDHSLGTAEIVRELPGGIRYYQLSTTSLQTGGQLLGKVIILKTITRQKQDQAKLLKTEKTLSILAERERLGRELHDVQGQFPCYVKTQTQAIELLLARNRLTEALEKLEQLKNAADAAFTDVRESIAGLKTAKAGRDFFETLQYWLNQFQNMSGIAVVYRGPKSLPSQWVSPEDEVQLLRIIQEALSNTRKHSGASRAEVAFSFAGSCLTVTIQDNGRGFNTSSYRKPAKFGLEILRERTAEIGGICRIRSGPGQGTVITVEILLP
ncbi:histidine kinase [Lucifera butyrica]|uniref:histidine kinase n=1 Tax=Lucifera butyrica TaxID=1351585 RepID=A0A498RDS8_9FIRM|nr:histidine kinase N-terminal 7TM domain-containing protein [Lucifera butyrica]VBB09479.1 histidine kinase [Lucifera butyrica]